MKGLVLTQLNCDCTICVATLDENFALEATIHDRWSINIASQTTLKTVDDKLEQNSSLAHLQREIAGIK